jgi:hypothetical protein
LVAQRENAPFIDDLNRGERFYRHIETIVTYKQEA